MESKQEYHGGAGGGKVVEVNPKPQKGLTSKLIDYLEKLIVKFMYDSSQPNHYLSGNFAPVPDETPPIKDLPVKGYLPVSNNTISLQISISIHNWVFETTNLF